MRIRQSFAVGSWADLGLLCIADSEAFHIIIIIHYISLYSLEWSVHNIHRNELI